MSDKPTYFKDPAIDKVMSIVIELAAEVHVLKDRNRILEKLLQQKGQLSPDEIDNWQPSPEEIADNNRERDEFLARLLRDVTEDLG
jgi:hypothetical protein